MRYFITILQWFLPGFISRKMYGVMATPRIRPPRPFKQEILTSAKESSIPFESFLIKKYIWEGKNGKTILFVHGWEGQTTNFYYLIDELLKMGYTIVSLDAPSHGFSSKGDTHMFHFSNVLEEQISLIKPNIIMSHSFGSMNIAKALQEHKSQSFDFWLMISTPLSFRLGFEGQAKKYGINTFIQKTLMKRVEEDTQDSFENLNMINYCSDLENIKKIMIVQSTADKVFSISWARELQKHIQDCELIELDGLDHYKILQSESLMNIIEEELKSIVV